MSRALCPTTSRTLVLAAVVTTGDVATKFFANRYLTEPVTVLPGVTLDRSHNSGVAFGMFSGAPPWLLVAGACVLVVSLAFAVSRHRPVVPWQAVGLLIGGALGNVLDRVGDGRVMDFIELPNWPSFNLADVAITGAVLVILWDTRRAEHGKSQPGSPASSASIAGTPSRRRADEQ